MMTDATNSNASAPGLMADLSPEALFHYFDAVAHGTPRAEALKAAVALDRATTPTRPAARFFDVVWSIVPGSRERARELVATWFEDKKGAGHFFTDEHCVCVEVREPEADRFVTDLRKMDREAGWSSDVIARVDTHGVTSRVAFGARRKPTLILKAVG